MISRVIYYRSPPTPRLGEIVNARTLETQVAHLLSHTHKEVRSLGESLKKAATGAAYNVNAESLQDLVSQIRALDPKLGARAEQELMREVRVAPTLVKYADPNPYEMETRRELRQAARGVDGEGTGGSLQGDCRPFGRRTAGSGDRDRRCCTSTVTIRTGRFGRRCRSRAKGGGARSSIWVRHRGKHDEMLRGFRAGHSSASTS